MATISSDQPAKLTIPARYLEDMRSAVIAELKSDSDGLHGAALEDRDSSARMLARSARLLDQVLAATGEVILTAERDNASNPLLHALEALVRLLLQRLETVAQYGPLPMGDVLDLAAELRWAAEEAIRIEPAVDDRLNESERRA